MAAHGPGPLPPDSDEIGLSQEFLSHMLGVRIAGVNEAIKELELQAVITQRRGFIKIVSREELERASCECYDLLRKDNARLFGSVGREHQAKSGRS